ncbi:hypothetical protein Bbelb_240700 [Branchiostoma belcheri]|nr:hypothetical protein Bbelb_240700 [Branchiostoma belcheri]
MGNDTDGRGSNLQSADNLLLGCGVVVGSCGVAVGTCGAAVGLCGVVAELCGVAAECSTRNQEVPGLSLDIFVLESSKFDIPGAALFARTPRAGVGTTVRNQEETVETDKNPLIPGRIRTHGSRATGRRSN